MFGITSNLSIEFHLIFIFRIFISNIFYTMSSLKSVERNKKVEKLLLFIFYVTHTHIYKLGRHMLKVKMIIYHQHNFLKYMIVILSEIFYFYLI